MIVRKKYKLRHQLLGILLQKFDSFSEPNATRKLSVKAEDTAILIEDLAKQLNISIDELKTITPPLVRAEEIQVNDFGKGICVYPWNDAQTAYDERKYIEIGRKKFNDDIYDVVKWVLPIALIIVAIFTTCTNIQLNKDKSNMQPQIEQINRQITTLEQSVDSLHRTKIGHDSVSFQKKKASDSLIK